MIEVLRKIWRFAGEEQGNIRKSMVLGFFYAIFHMFQIAAIYVVVLALVDGSSSAAPTWQALVLLLVSILGRAIMNRFSQLQQTHAGYFMTANKRLHMGDKLKRIPMGYFNDQSLGELTGIATTVLDEVESAGAMVLVTILGGLINSAVMLLCVLFWDWRIGLLALAGMALYLLLLSRMEKQSAKIAPKRQRDEARLVEAVLEQLQGMSVIKSFNLTGKGDKRIRRALEDSRENNLAVEKLFTPYIWAQEMALHLFSVLILAAAVWLYLSGSLTLANALMAVIISFLIFSQIQSAGSGVSALRLVGSSIDHANQVDAIPEMDQKGTALHPGSHDIVFDHVNFSYGSRPILKDVSLTIPDRTSTAIVGPSGSGKTTLCNLIARFWDVEGGRVSIGGRDVRTYTLESLMEQVSMVFQRVYLFHDTIENNIKFGCPNATHEQVVEAAGKACCHDFISALPDGYDTVIGEGGATLSGGEKQRISIARCLLKNAPIVIFDEATANVDPENEDQLQRAIEALTRETTVLMIAYRLKNVRNADQILVLYRPAAGGEHPDGGAERPGGHLPRFCVRADGGGSLVSVTSPFENKCRARQLISLSGSTYWWYQSTLTILPTTPKLTNVIFARLSGLGSHTSQYPFHTHKRFLPESAVKRILAVIPHHKEIVLRHNENPGGSCQFLIHREGTVLVIERDRVPSHRHNALDQRLALVAEHDDVAPA